MAREVLSIDWDSSTLRLLQVRIKSGQMEVRRAVSVLVPDDVDVHSASSFGDFIRAVLRDQRISTRRAMIDLPRDQVVLHTFVLPQAVDADLPGMVRFQMARELPFAAEEAIIDFAVTRRIAAGGTDDAEGKGASASLSAMDALAGARKRGIEVLVAAVRRDAVDHVRAVFRQAGLTLLRVGLRPYASLVVATDAIDAKTVETAMFVDVGPVMTEIDVIGDGRLAFSRSAQVAVPLAPEYPAEDADTAIRELTIEMLRTFQAYRASEHGGELDEIIIAGGTGVEERLAEQVEARMGVSTRLFTPPSDLVLASGRAAQLRGFAASFGLALGHARSGVLHFDFLNPKRPVDREAIEKRQTPVAVACVAVLVVAGLVGARQRVAGTRAEADAAMETATKAKAEAKKAKKFNALVKQAEQWEKESVVWLDVLREFGAVFPDRDNIYLTSLTAMDHARGANLKMRSKAHRDEDVVELMEGLTRHSGDWKFEPKASQVVLKAPGHSKKRKKDHYPTSSSITVQLTGKTRPPRPKSKPAKATTTTSRPAAPTTTRSRPASRTASRPHVEASP